MSAILKLLSLLLRAEDREEILGDLEETCRRLESTHGQARARWWLLRQAVTLPPRLAVQSLVDRVASHRIPAGRSGPGHGWRLLPMENLLRDVRFGFRGLRRRPVFALTAILTLAVGVGMTTTMFTLVDAVLLRPLHGTHTDNLVYLELDARNGDLTTSPTPELLRLIRDHASSFSRVEAYAIRNYSVRADGEPLRLRGAQSSVGFFDFLGVRTRLGRGFLPGDGTGFGSPVVVLSHTLWKERFGERPDVLGRTLVVEGVSHEIVGVLPRAFRVDTPREALFWTPAGGAGAFFQEGMPLEGALARLADGVTLEAAQAEMDAIVQNNPLSRRAELDWSARLKTPSDLMDPELKRAILLLQAGAVLVLLIACGNLTNLLLVQGDVRARELAVRASMGAGRSRLIRQLLVECSVLGALGAVGGILLTLWALDALPLFLPPGYAGFSINSMVLLFSTALSMMGVLIAGLLPAIKGARRDLAQTIKGGLEPRRRVLRKVGVRQVLVSVEVAMALVLLISAGLLLKSFAGLASVDVGFPRQDLLTLRLELPEESYGEEEGRLAFVNRLEHELEDRIPPELAEVTLATGLVEGLSASMAPLTREGAEEGQDAPGLLLVWAVAPDYFDVVGVPMDQGRGFQDTDGPESEPVVIINREVARRYFPEGHAVGQRLRVQETPHRVVGVAGSVNLPSLAQSRFGDQQLFFPLQQRPSSNPTIVARVRGDASATVARLKEAVWAVDPALPVQEISLVEDALAESLTRERSNAILMVLFAVTALVLGAVGIYGVVAYSVGRQIREIGIRLSLGATQGREVARVVRAGLGTVGVGLVMGSLGIAAVAAPLSGLLYEVDARDPWILTPGVILVGAVALLATWLPARRAAGSAPVQALKTE